MKNGPPVRTCAQIVNWRHQIIHWKLVRSYFLVSNNLECINPDFVNDSNKKENITTMRDVVFLTDGYHNVL